MEGRKKGIILILLSGAAVILLSGILFTGRMKETDQLERDAYGGADKEIRMTMQIEGGEEETMDVHVSSRKYTEEEIQELFEQAVSRLESVVKGENKSLDRVDKDLNLPYSLEGFPFRIAWEMDRYDVMNMDGRIQEETIKKVDTEGTGVLVTVTGIFSYEEWEAAQEMTVRICRPEEKEQSIKDQVMARIHQVDDSTVSSPYLKLPKSINGRKITWRTETTSVPAAVLLISAAVVFPMVRNKQKEEEQIKKKQQQMIVDYPEILSQISLLLNAGMTVRAAWQKIVEDYGTQKKRTGRERAAYEEMVLAWKEIQSGIPESESYERFSRRCGLPEYRKLGIVLAQNIKKGVRGTAELLNVEMTDVMEDRKSRAKQAGEEAGTKLLLPMLMMLTVVMLIVVVPAFWSVQS